MINLTYNQESTTAIYLQLAKQMIQGMKEGKLKLGEKLPSVRKLANELNVSKTTIENCYDHLLSEGYIISIPKSGYYCDMPNTKKEMIIEEKEEINYLYDLSSRSIETSHFDQQVWRRYSRIIYNQDEFISSYGNNQGELHLRKALKGYLYDQRGIITNENEIIIGAGIQPLLYLLCSIAKKKVLRVGFFEPIFFQAQIVFEDCHHQIIHVKDIEELRYLDLDYLYITPASLNFTREKQNEFTKILQSITTIVIEDDHNQEMHYLTPAKLAMYSYLDYNRVIFLSSFSKLLLPSVRIALMVVPTSILNKISENIDKYNQTASKIEQEMLAYYIDDGHFKRRIHSLKKLYRKKKEIMEKQLLHYFNQDQIIFHETQLCFEIKGTFDELFYQNARNKKIHLSYSKSNLNLYIGGIKIEDIESVIQMLF